MRNDLRFLVFTFQNDLETEMEVNQNAVTQMPQNLYYGRHEPGLEVIYRLQLSIGIGFWPAWKFRQ